MGDKDGSNKPRALPQALEMKISISDEYESQSYKGDEDFTYGSNGKRPPALLAEFTQVGTQTDSGEGQQECPA